MTTEAGTPLTDAKAVIVVDAQPFPLGAFALDPYEAVSADFARDLERQLAEAQAEAADHVSAVDEENFQLKKRIAQAEADKRALVEALEELVRLKDLHDLIETGIGIVRTERDLMQVDYGKNKPKAWDAARAALKGAEK